MANQQPQVVMVERGKAYSGSRPGLDFGDVLSFFFFGGASIANLVFAYWFSKYIWAWKVMSFMPDIGTGPKTDGTNMVWFCWVMVAVYFFNALNTMTTNYQRTALAWFHTLSGAVVFFTAVYAAIDAARGMQITSTQSNVIWLTIGTGVCCLMMGGVATRQVRRYIGGDIPQAHG